MRSAAGHATGNTQRRGFLDRRVGIPASKEGDRHPPLAAEAGSSTAFTQDDRRGRSGGPESLCRPGAGGEAAGEGARRRSGTRGWPAGAAAAGLPIARVVRDHRAAAEEVRGRRNSASRRWRRRAPSAVCRLWGTSGKQEKVDVDVIKGDDRMREMT
jgi:hypothetical protein